MALKQLGKDIVLIVLQSHSTLFDPLGLAKPVRLALFSRDAQWIPQNLWQDRQQLERQDQETTARLANFAHMVGASVVNPFDYLSRGAITSCKRPSGRNTTSAGPTVTISEGSLSSGSVLRASALTERTNRLHSPVIGADPWTESLGAFSRRRTVAGFYRRGRCSPIEARPGCRAH
jgi:hypothetical protein